MTHPGRAAIMAAVFAATAAIAATMPLLAQSSGRTQHGHPDLQGLWVNNTATPLERPREVNGRPSFSEAEAKDYVQRYQLDRTVAISRNKSFELDAAGDLDTYEPGDLLPGRRTSMINDPADGMIPPLTPDARKRLTERNQHLDAHYAENPEDLTFAERCLIVANTYIPPLLPAFYNNTVQIVQTADSVVFLSEQIHDARVISLTRRTHLPASVTRWAGDSIGHWEGSTLVVDTTNFSTRTTFRGSGPQLHLIERFSLSDENTLKYEFTIDDPSFVRNWSADSQMRRTSEPMFEYACHEANYSMGYILSGARFSEKAR